MNEIKTFRYDYRPSNAYVDFMTLPPIEVGVLMQICNLIYIHEAPIDYDPKWISQSLRDMGSAKTKNIIENLIKKGHIFVVPGGEFEGKIAKKMCLIQIKNAAKLRKNFRKTSQISRVLEYVFDTTIEENQDFNPKQGTGAELPPIVPLGGHEPKRRKNRKEKRNEEIAAALDEIGYSELEREIQKADNPRNQNSENEDRNDNALDRSEL